MSASVVSREQWKQRSNMRPILPATPDTTPPDNALLGTRRLSHMGTGGNRGPATCGCVFCREILPGMAGSLDQVLRQTQRVWPTRHDHKPDITLTRESTGREPLVERRGSRSPTGPVGGQQKD